MELEKLFLQRKGNAMFNTSYPLHPNDWRKFKVEGELNYTNCQLLSFYIHIPFCQHLCPFCEYVRTHVPDIGLQRNYLISLERDINLFLNAYPSITLAGFDIGGGTPTSLDEGCFEALMGIYRRVLDRVNVTDDFEPSIEATFQTITPAKVHMIREAGIGRVSFGIQSSVGRVQRSNGRINPEVELMQSVLNMIHSAGIQKVNIDLMYGLKSQSLPDVRKDIDIIEKLSPEQVTLYELRTNLLHTREYASKEQLYQCYSALYEDLVSLGYSARFGQNTFTKNKCDLGLSSYLRHRMIDFMPYKGFGLSAQSLSSSGVSYNVGKQEQPVRGILGRDSYPSEATYQLSNFELLSKYLAVSAYYGQISLTVASRILGEDFLVYFKEEIEFCLFHGYVILDDAAMTITRKGYQYYGAVFSLFYLKV